MRQKLAIGAALAGAAVLGAIAVAFSNAREGAQTRFGADDEAAIREIVRSYLLENPEILIESLNAYADNERAQEAARMKDMAKANLSELLDDRHGFSAGADLAQASVVVIEFFDYHCSYCKRASQVVRNLAQSDPSVQVVFREFPILKEESDYAAEVALAARAQGKYLDLHLELMDSSGVLTKERLEKIAKKAGLDFARIERDLKDPAIEEAIVETHRIAAAMGVEGTPAFIVATMDGSFVDVMPGYHPERLAAMINEAKAATSKGAPATLGSD